MEILDKIIEEIKEKELYYKEGVIGDSGMVKIEDVINILKQYIK